MARPARESLPWDEDLKSSARDGRKAKDTRSVPEPVERRARAAVVEPKVPIKLPKSDAQLADLWWSLRKKRLAAEKVAKELEEQEKFCKAALIDRVPQSKATGIAGQLVRVSIVKKNKPRPEDWGKIYAHIRKTGDFGLLNRALNSSHVEELWEAKKKIPGVGTFPVKDLSYSEL